MGAMQSQLHQRSRLGPTSVWAETLDRGETPGLGKALPLGAGAQDRYCPFQGGMNQNPPF